MTWLFGGPRKRYPLVVPENRLNHLARWWPDLKITQMKARQQIPVEKRLEKIENVDFGQVIYQTMATAEISFRRFPKDAIPLGELQKMLSERGFPEATAEELAYHHHLSLEDPKIETDIQLRFVRWGVVKKIWERTVAGAGNPNEQIYKLIQLIKEARQAAGDKSDASKGFLVLETFIPGNLNDVLLYDRDLMKALRRDNMILAPEDVRKFPLVTHGYETESVPL